MERKAGVAGEPWKTKAIIEQLRLRDMLLKTAGRSNVKADWDTYKLARNKCVNIIERNCFEKYKGNSKAMWKTIKSLMSARKSDICMNLDDHSNEQVVETFNDYFASIPNKLRMLMPQQLYDVSKLKTFVSSRKSDAVNF